MATIDQRFEITVICARCGGKLEAWQSLGGCLAVGPCDACIDQVTSAALNEKEAETDGE